jgi:hypothetical protein
LFDLLGWEGGNQGAETVDAERLDLRTSEFQSFLQNLLELSIVLCQLVTAVKEHCA